MQFNLTLIFFLALFGKTLDKRVSPNMKAILACNHRYMFSGTGVYDILKSTVIGSPEDFDILWLSREETKMTRTVTL